MAKRNYMPAELLYLWSQAANRQSMREHFSSYQGKGKRRITILLSMVAYSLPCEVYPRRERKIAIWRLTFWKVTTDFKDYNCR
jgi:hypothetical protein